MGPLIFVRFEPKEGQESRVEALLRDMVVKTRQEPGNLRYDLFQATSAAGRRIFCLIERYADDAARQAHRATEHYKAYRAEVVDLLAEPIAVIDLDPLDAQGS